jgi:hypothetical protein
MNRIIKQWRSRFGPSSGLCLFLLIVLVYEIAQLVFYNVVTYKVLFHSDASIKNLLVGEILRTKQLFPADWFSPDNVWVLANHIYVLILFPFFRVNSFGLHAAAGIANVVVLLAVVWFVLAKLEFRLVTRLLAVTVLFAGQSYYMGENLFGQAAYGFILMLTLLNLALLFFAMEHSSAGWKVFAGCCLLFGLVLFLTVLGGLRWLLTLTVPLLLTSFIYVLFFRLDKARLQALLWLTLIVILASGLGFALGNSLNHAHSVIANKQSSGFANSDRIVSNAQLIVLGLLYLFGALPAPNAQLFSIAGVQASYSFFFMCLVLLGAVLTTRQLRVAQKPSAIYFAIFTVTSLLLNLYFLLFTNVSVDINSSRYLVVPVILLLIMGLQYVDSVWPRSGNSTRWTAGLIIMIIPLYLLSPYNMVAPAIGSIDTRGGRLNVAFRTSQAERLADFLVAQKQSYCYAPFWYADAITVLTDSTVQVRQILLQNQLPVPFHWLASLSWFKPEAHQGPTCLILTKIEQAAISPDKMATYLGQPERVLEFEDLSIVLYPFNLAAKLPNWP